MTIPESGISHSRGDVHTIEVKLQEFEQLFNTIDPSPFHDRPRLGRIHRELGNGISIAGAALAGRLSGKSPSGRGRADRNRAGPT